MSLLRVLHVVSTLDRGGLETFVMNVYRNINKSYLQFDFLVLRQSREGAFEKEIIELGGRIFKVPYITDVGHFGFLKALNCFFIQHREYRIVHSHANAISGLVLSTAQKAGVPIRIAHSHSSRYGKSFIEIIYKKYSAYLIGGSATHFFACSEQAGKKLFGKKSKQMKVLTNGIDVQKYVYDAGMATKVKSDLCIDNSSFVIGHIGRFEAVKNHRLVIDVFREVLKIKPTAILLLIGDGSLKQEIEQRVICLKIQGNVQFLGVRSDVHELLQAIDCVVFPSLYEGLPVALVEAQAAGIRCIISDTISPEVDMGANLVEFISLLKPASQWAKRCVEGMTKNDTSYQIKEKGYDILTTANYLENFYTDCAKEIGVI